jgi:hypothetical protein
VLCWGALGPRDASWRWVAWVAWVAWMAIVAWAVVFGLLSPAGVFEDLEDLLDQGLALVGWEVSGVDGLFI